MKTEIIVHGLESTTPVRDYVVRRLGFAFGRTQQLMRSVVVRLRDVNGPRGGVDKSCSVQLSLPGQTPVIVTERSHLIERAIDRAINKAAHAISRRLRKQRGTQRQRKDHLGATLNLA